MTKHRTFVSARVIALILGATLIGGGKASADQVIADDLIVQGSACVGLDCVNNESFGFDTLRLKENNTRIKFDDTSTSAGFANNSWQLTANDSASGGLNKFSIENTTVATVPFTVVGPAPTNSVFIASNGKVGFRTATPVLDLHVTTTDTPAHRFEQTSAGGFTAQTWDVAGNEANFFVRDVTGGSRLPFRIRPGAPTSSVDISAAGNVGIGLPAPVSKLHVVGTSAAPASSGATASGAVRLDNTGNQGNVLDFGNMTASPFGSWLQAHSRVDQAVNNPILLNPNGGNIGVGTTSPSARLHTVGSVRLEGVAGCGGGIQSDGSGNLSCIVSSRQFKNITGELPSDVALANVMALRPQTGSYKSTPDVPEHWLIAEDVAAVDPALAGMHEGKPHVVKTQNVVADLVAVVQQQQRQIEELRRLVAAK
jgi:hypothetical protein